MIELIKAFQNEFKEEWESSNVFRLEDNILVRTPQREYLVYNVSTKQWNNSHYKQLENETFLLTFCQPKQRVFRSTYLGYYLNTYYIEELYANDLKFLFPEYEFIVEQAMKLQIPFVLNAFRQNSAELLKNMNSTSLVKATEMSVKQLSAFQERIQLMKSDAVYYLVRLNKFVPTFKGINEELFNTMCDIALNDRVSNSDLDFYNESILSKPGNISQKLIKIQGYIKNNFSEYRVNWNALKELNKLDLSEFPEFPKADLLKDLISAIHAKVIEYRDEVLYHDLNEKYNNFKEILKKFEYSEDKYCIIAPQVVQELDIEGNVLHHCVGSYKHNLAGGNEIILFLRHSEDPTKPFYTIDLDPEGYIRQIHTRYNGNIKDDPEKESIKLFLDNWASAKSDIINKKSLKLNYGALCAL